MSSISEIDDALGSDSLFKQVAIPEALLAEYRIYEAERKRRLMQLAIGVGLAFYLGYPLIDWLIVPDIFWINLTMRLFIALPIGLIVLIVLRNRQRSIFEHQVAAGFLAITYAALFCAVMTQSSAPAAAVYLTANNAIIIFAVTMMGLPFLLAAACTSTIIAFQALAGWASSFGSTGTMLATLTIGLAVATPALYANWALQNERRRHFLSMKREKFDRWTIADQRDMLERLAAIDPLTGLANRRGLDASIVSDLSRADETSTFVVAMIDIDHFKAYNDHYGHPAGDAALKRVAGALARVMPSGVRVARMGGEEFALATIKVQPMELELCGARLRKAVRDLAIRHGAGEAGPIVTVSIGITTGPPKDGSIEALFESADKALYEAKTSGRDRAVIKQESLEDTAASPPPAATGEAGL